MIFSKAKEMFRELTKRYFAGARVIYSEQSRVSKSNMPLVVLTFRDPERQLMPNIRHIDGHDVKSFNTRVYVDVDLFTHGKPEYENGQIIGYSNSAQEDMLAFVDYLYSEKIAEICQINNVSIMAEKSVKNMSGFLTETVYEYRSRITVTLDFIHSMIEMNGVLSECSIEYPTGRFDEETGEEIFTSEEPVETDSTTGIFSLAYKDKFKRARVVPKFDGSTSSGGGSEELASEKIGYYTEVLITEEE